MPKHFPRREKFYRAFTLIEILIVVIILGILAAIVIPQVGSASSTARQNTMAEELRFMRQAIEAANYQHNDVSAGYPAGNSGAAPDAADFITQMITTTDSAYNSNSSVNALGPYISSMPIDSVNGLSTILIIANGATFPTAADGQYGWIYQPSTLTFKSDALGNDQSGASYFSY